MTVAMLVRFETRLKWLALMLGIASVVSVTMNWHLSAMLLSLPFCLIWMVYGWLHNERQLKLINALFTALYAFGIARYYMVS